ncbi:MAG: aminomethyl-transferring glycine dehydrogenase subunit GcvPB [Candidatus Thermoplasmatota archaeon]|nr:glycine dehydrogenase subunit 2 [Euryarchaeota archaeon]MBU4033033.1 aminomethyl-transferring glycine dehydrogenase subunit GcvPB [Candidatus Thermoplasmatota archaeon]MBU4071219.1 aminomethyl-transferring glycine dehydrogenase subunit GcvPB [Candidatus Thermoplasmatota archaeon]MBU4145068.1 aminomethyl-transferring glycine dehydrogenase subunit GcvPB [Candidatus Thermoplasmatota archaeon]MBU4592786.1 aminomethyl-transferring glycine dehydrogenase subunit GcvPB [Candidatus Thermoplasmatota a
MSYRQARHDVPLIYEAFSDDVIYNIKINEYLPENIIREKRPNIPRLCERDLVKHFTTLSQMNFGVDSGFYPLGSCTMKYNPKINDEMASLPGSAMIHPHQPDSQVQGTLQIMYELQEMLAHITGMKAVSLQPAAGAHGEFTGMLIARAYHESRGEKRDQVVLPDTSHGTNPASAAMAGYDIITIPSKNGIVDLDALAAAVSERTAAFMLTNPNTLGIFESDAAEIARIVHDAGGLLYYDGANFNAIMGKTSPGKMGFDIVHLNLHKTFSTPHGGGGPGAGPVGVVEKLAEFLPVPMVAKDGERYFLDYDLKKSIGKVHGFHGNWGVLIRAYAYILAQGGDGLTEVTERAVLNSNYLRSRVEKFLEVPYPGLRKHEFVASGAKLREKGIRTLDVAKRLIDHGFHPPTIYFPLIVDEAIMIEPTETESKSTLDAFADALERVVNEPAEVLHDAPTTASVRRLNETDAAKNLILSYRDYVEFKKK